MEGVKKKSHLMLYIGIAAIVVAAVAYFLIKGNSGAGVTYGQPVPASFLSTLSTIANNNTLASSVGTQAYLGLKPSSYIQKVSLSSLTNNGKPELLYIGADYCPYCAATRWALSIALMRFGTLTNLKYMASSATDVFPNTPTFSYVGYNYTSNYISFVAVETQDRLGNPLQNLTANQTSIASKYGSGGIPFIDVGNIYAESGSIASPGVLDGNSWTGISSQLTNPNSTIAQDEIGAANIYTAEICKMINNTASVCSQGYVKQAQSIFLS